MTEPMNDEELNVIRGAVERAELFDEETLPLAFSDRKRLLAEVERLHAELSATRRERDDLAVRFSARVVIGETIGELMNERDELTRRLRDALGKTGDSHER